LGLKLQSLEIKTPEDFEGAFRVAAKAGIDASKIELISLQFNLLNGIC
jgi:hypothetical protein